MVVSLTLLPISIPAIMAFATLNLAAGTLAHLPSTSETNRFFWTDFHQTHHEHPETNHGFFLPFWDRVAGTRRLT